jgi:threonine/homoserine/homoserine lactone efflux protein
MPDLPILLKGCLLGFAIAAPVGPIGVLCIRRTLADGRTIGFLSGLGAATADMLYGAIAAFGISTVQIVLVSQQTWLQLIGGLFLVYLGLRTFLARPPDAAAAVGARKGRLSAFLTTLGLTLTNPATIISFTVIFASFRLDPASGGLAAAAVLVLGVFLGSASWWMLLSSGVSLLRDRFTSAWMIWVNRLAGVVILGFGAAAILLR